MLYQPTTIQPTPPPAPPSEFSSEYQAPSSLTSGTAYGGARPHGATHGAGDRRLSEAESRWKHYYLGAPGTLLGAALGLLLGFILTREPILTKLKKYDTDYNRVARDMLLQLGVLWLRAVMCVMLPLTILNLTLVTAEIAATRRWSHIGWRAVALSCLTSLLVVTQGMTVGQFFSSYFAGQKYYFRLPPFTFKCPTSPKDMLLVAAKTNELYCGPTNVTSWPAISFLLNDTTTVLQVAPGLKRFVDYGSSINEVISTLFYTPNFPNAASNTNLVTLVLFAFTFGICAGTYTKHAKREQLFNLLRELVSIFEIMTKWITTVTPFAIVFLIAGPIYAGTHNPFLGTTAAFPQGNDLVHLMWFILAYVAVSLFHALVVLPALLLVCTCTNPLKLLWQMKEALIYAFGTASSRKSLPVLRSNYSRAMGRSLPISRFLLEMGASLNKSGGALYICLALVWLFYNAGLEDYFTPTKMALAAVLSTLGSYLVAPVRNGGIVVVIGAFAMLTGLPTPYAFNFLLLTECIIDPIATVLNAWTNVVVTRVVERDV
ncbi:Aste57867_11362 [Aphanomyces stellatus]|uniref:Amino acid transporter n=1 Tax=Aphanomyces stellatus TaxID=120398 RepID=A0A485KSU7_9STRA|nr:hypothetical protein As57867_011320 [Aphanomyces stellatus]VFT88224.1 Aste57867_11362 [Aphanomyces stellatus]